MYPYMYDNFYDFYTWRVTYSITVNVAARTLTLYKNGAIVKSFPVAVGKPATPTPRGTRKIINKAVNPGGVFGARWMGIGNHYGIHGTNNPSSIGKAVTNGCIRMYNNDVIELFNIVSIGTIVTII